LQLQLRNCNSNCATEGANNAKARKLQKRMERVDEFYPLFLL